MQVEIIETRTKWEWTSLRINYGIDLLSANKILFSLFHLTGKPRLNIIFLFMNLLFLLKFFRYPIYFLLFNYFSLFHESSLGKRASLFHLKTVMHLKRIIIVAKIWFSTWLSWKREQLLYSVLNSVALALMSYNDALITRFVERRRNFAKDTAYITSLFAAMKMEKDLKNRKMVGASFETHFN